MCYKENRRPVEACPSTFWRSEKKKKQKQRKKRKGFEASTIKSLSLRSKCYCFSHSRESKIQKFSLSITILFSVLWLLNFEIHLAGPKINFYIFNVIKNCKIFPSNVYHFQYDQRFVFKRETCKEYICKNLLNLDCQGSICFEIF